MASTNVITEIMQYLRLLVQLTAMVSGSDGQECHCYLRSASAGDWTIRDDCDSKNRASERYLLWLLMAHMDFISP